jgi:hypothetical protein
VSPIAKTSVKIPADDDIKPMQTVQLRSVNTKPSADTENVVKASRRLSATSPKPVDTTPRKKSSTIMARAAFWDSRINSETHETDMEFPEMPDNSFKE